MASIIEKSGKSKCFMSNVRRFHGKKPAPDGNMWGAILPYDAFAAASLSFSDGLRSVSAQVRGKRISCERCQDSAMLFFTGNVMVAGVFDGYLEDGALFSRGMAGALMDICRETKGHLLRSEIDASMLLDLAISRMLGYSSAIALKNESSGTTAVVAVVGENGVYTVAGAGDSDAFWVGCTVSRLLDCKDAYVTGGGLRPIAGMTTSDYVDCRCIVRNSVQRCRPPGTRIELAKGRLDTGMLLLVSDGITKNLTMLLDKSGTIERVGWCEDIAGIVWQAVGDTVATGQALLDEVESRIMAVQEGGQAVHFRPGRVLVPADDDITIIAIMRNI